MRCYFYPRSPCGERPIYMGSKEQALKFLSTLSLRRATRVRLHWRGQQNHFYPRSPCGERRLPVLCTSFAEAISIHALLAESDVYVSYNQYNNTNISIHALLAESDSLRQLQSALCRNFYPRSPCGERPYQCQIDQQRSSISIHALLAESDFRGWTLNINGPIFLSTLSLRRATC